MNKPSSVGVGELSPYEVACVELDPRLDATSHPHVAFIETRDPDGGRTRWSRERALAAIRQGERFVVVTGGNGSRALMQPGLCPRCPFFTLLVDPPEALPPPCQPRSAANSRFHGRASNRSQGV